MNIAQTREIAWVRGICASGDSRALRVRAKLSLREIAAPCSVSSSTVDRWEKGDALPTGARALAYARMLRTLQRREARNAVTA